MCVVSRQISNIVCIAARYLKDVINVGETQQAGPLSFVDWLDQDVADAQGTQTPLLGAFLAFLCVFMA